MINTCEVCKKRFALPLSKIKRGGGRFCSIACRTVTRAPKEVFSEQIKAITLAAEKDAHDAVINFKRDLNIELGKKGMFGVDVGRKLGIALPALNAMLKRDDLTFSGAARYARTVGCKLVVKLVPVK